MSHTEQYYALYDARYRRVYEQGVPFWTGNPAEIEETAALLDDFLRHCDATPGRERVVEFGCGEGHLAAHLLSLGFDYLGVDLSPAALEKARLRTGVGPSGGAFLQADLTDLSSVPSGSFDISIDNYALHMLVTDPDRRRYLSEVRRVLRKGGHAYFHVNYDERGFPELIASYDEYVTRRRPDVTTLEDRVGFVDGQPATIQLPRLPARADNEEGYREEFESAGLCVKHFERTGYSCLIYVKV